MLKSFDPEIKPILIFGAVLIVYAISSAGFFLYWGLPIFLRFYHEGFYLPLVFFVGVIMFYLLTGIGVVSLTRWGCHLFKFFLYLHFFVGFPIMTVISYFTLSYIRRHQIERHFGLSPGSVFGQPRRFTLPAKLLLIALAAGLVALYLWVMITF